jgi:hypothetical protein
MLHHILSLEELGSDLQQQAENGKRVLALVRELAPQVSRIYLGGRQLRDDLTS